MSPDIPFATPPSLVKPEGRVLFKGTPATGSKAPAEASRPRVGHFKEFERFGYQPLEDTALSGLSLEEAVDKGRQRVWGSSLLLDARQSPLSASRKPKAALLALQNAVELEVLEAQEFAKAHGERCASMLLLGGKDAIIDGRSERDMIDLRASHLMLIYKGTSALAAHKVLVSEMCHAGLLPNGGEGLIHSRLSATDAFNSRKEVGPSYVGQKYKMYLREENEGPGKDEYNWPSQNNSPVQAALDGNGKNSPLYSPATVPGSPDPQTSSPKVMSEVEASVEGALLFVKSCVQSPPPVDRGEGSGQRDASAVLAGNCCCAYAAGMFLLQEVVFEGGFEVSRMLLEPREGWQEQGAKGVGAARTTCLPVCTPVKPLTLQYIDDKVVLVTPGSSQGQETTVGVLPVREGGQLLFVKPHRMRTGMIFPILWSQVTGTVSWMAYHQRHCGPQCL